MPSWFSPPTSFQSMMGPLLKYKPFLPYTASVSDCVLVSPHRRPTEVPGVSDPAREQLQTLYLSLYPRQLHQDEDGGAPSRGRGEWGKEQAGGPEGDNFRRPFPWVLSGRSDSLPTASVVQHPDQGRKNLSSRTAWATFPTLRVQSETCRGKGRERKIKEKSRHLERIMPRT